MTLTLHELKKMHDTAFTYSQTTREQAANDTVFAYITNWDDDILDSSTLQYKGEFNVLRKAQRQIIADLNYNPVQVDFLPTGGTRKDAADVLDGLYITDDTYNGTHNAYEVGRNEAVVCGVGAWRIYAKYESIRSDNRNQVIRRKPIHEANNCVFWDPQAKLLDKSDAKWVSVLEAYSKDGYLDLVEELTGERLDSVPINSFSHPDHSYTFPWIMGEGFKVYVTRFYYREIIKDTMLTLADPFGSEVSLWETTLDSVMDDMLDLGYEITSEKLVERYIVTEYIASGSEIFSDLRVAGEHIPVVPMYGEHAYIEGEEHYEGIVRLAKDPQRFRNFGMSYLGDILSRSPRQKPIYYGEQIAGYEDMYDEGSDNNFPYMLMNLKDSDGSPLPLGPVGETPEQRIPQALALSLSMSKGAVEDVANPGTPQDMVDPETSGKAVYAMQNRLDMQSETYQTHFKHSKRRDAEIYASMASEIYDVPREVSLTMKDGTKKETEVMQHVIDEETGDLVVINDLRDSTFDVTSKIGPSYSTKKEQTAEKLTQVVVSMDSGDPMRRILQLKLLTLMDGVEFEDVREYVNIQLVLSGIREPQTDKEIKAMEQAKNAPPKPDANLELAKAEMLKGEADMLEANIKQAKVKMDAMNETMKRKIDQFEAQTDRMEMQIKAKLANADVKYKRADTLSKQVDSSSKVIELQSKKVGDMSNVELTQQLMAG